MLNAYDLVSKEMWHDISVTENICFQQKDMMRVVLTVGLMLGIFALSSLLTYHNQFPDQKLGFGISYRRETLMSGFSKSEGSGRWSYRHWWVFLDRAIRRDDQHCLVIHGAIIVRGSVPPHRASTIYGSRTLDRDPLQLRELDPPQQSLAPHLGLGRRVYRSIELGKNEPELTHQNRIEQHTVILILRCRGTWNVMSDRQYGPENEMGPTRNSYSLGTSTVDSSTLHAAAQASSNACKATETELFF